MVAEDRYVHVKREKKGKGRGAKPPKSNAELRAEKGQFDFDEINGFKLKEVEWTVPDSQTRKRRRRAFGSFREEFLKYVGKNFEKELYEMGMNAKQVEMVKKGCAPSGYNVHHKLPIHGGGKNEMSNLILMPVPPHDELHHKVMDPQVRNMQTGDSKKVLIPWTDDMVYVSPERKKNRAPKSAIIAKMAQNAGR